MKVNPYNSLRQVDKVTIEYASAQGVLQYHPALAERHYRKQGIGGQCH